MNVKTVEIKNPEIDQQQALEAQLQKATHKVTSEVTKAVTNTVLDMLERKSNEILEHVNKVAKPREVAIAVKINDKDFKKLKNPAHPMLGELISTLLSGMNPLLVGPAGSGKTMMAAQAAEALELKYGHLCFSAGVSETWLFGRQTPVGFIAGDFFTLYKNGGLFLADEMDAADANLLLTINTALANGHLYNPINGESVERHKDFYFVGAANTFGKGGTTVYTGRTRLDAATLDRFVTLEVDYIKEVEDSICTDKDLADWLRGIRKAIATKGSQEVISYRAFDKAFRLRKSGVSDKRISEILFAAFPESTKALMPILK
tara:strand:- start:3738 stop:4691 length:954 start_codon:yes stop_codon:yes gene_type:complete